MVLAMYSADAVYISCLLDFDVSVCMGKKVIFFMFYGL